MTIARIQVTNKKSGGTLTLYTGSTQAIQSYRGRSYRNTTSTGCARTAKLCTKCYRKRLQLTPEMDSTSLLKEGLCSMHNHKYELNTHPICSVQMFDEALERGWVRPEMCSNWRTFEEILEPQKPLAVDTNAKVFTCIHVLNSLEEPIDASKVLVGAIEVSSRKELNMITLMFVEAHCMRPTGITSHAMPVISTSYIQSVLEVPHLGGPLSITSKASSSGNGTKVSARKEASLVRACNPDLTDSELSVA
ncbi:hypothetical protein BJ508DRAFT_313295 [Ascobolus immersus RN42]|uniref:Uncharacterized protein n=1 Tax=Ascobolus immersus RN42 TaxID=1160509 RepID=A0A3N4HWE9_ASCIM|nr:hypothetical protein BJ508DRAFT_313295 [Ascobolus immersus RN42]